MITKATNKYFLKSSEVKEILGISNTEFYTLMRKNLLTHYRIGNRYRIKATDLQRFIDNHKDGGNEKCTIPLKPAS